MVLFFRVVFSVGPNGFMVFFFRKSGHGAAVGQTVWTDMNYYMSRLTSLMFDEQWDDLYQYESENADSGIENNAKDILGLIKEHARGNQKN